MGVFCKRWVKFFRKSFFLYLLARLVDWHDMEGIIISNNFL